MNATTYQFILVLKNIEDNSLTWLDNLFIAGCNDALVRVKAGTVYLDFDREASSLEEAVMSAIVDVESAGIGAIVISVAPEDLVTEAEIAKRLQLNRQTISLWMQKKRRTDLPFPAPVMKVAERSALWKWREVAEWSHQNGIITDKTTTDNAIFLEAVNVALTMRQVAGYSLTKRLFQRLSQQQ